MASSVTSLSSASEGVKFALQVIGRENITLKEKQMQILRLVIVEKKDALAVLPTGFGKSLIYQHMAPFADVHSALILASDRQKPTRLSWSCHLCMLLSETR